MEKILFCISNNKKLTNRIAKQYHYQIGEIYQNVFKDGEMMVKSLSDVKDKHAIIISSIYKPAVINLFKILLLIDSIKRMGVAKISLVIPYLGFSRQERVADVNEPVSCQVVANLLNTTNVDEIITFDLHHPVINQFFNIPFKAIQTTDIFAKYYLDLLLHNNIDQKDVMIIAPDHGANERAKLLAKAMDIPNQVAILTKHRPRPNECETLGIDSQVKDKFCIIIDDIIDTGGTICHGAALLFERGARDVVVGASHGVLSNHAASKLKEAKISNIAVCNTIEKRYDKFVNVLDIKDTLMKNI